NEEHMKNKELKDMYKNLSNKEENVFNIPQYIIECKDNFDFITEYFKRINTFKKYTTSDQNLNNELEQRKKSEGRKNILISDIELVKDKDEDLYEYMSYNYLQYINSLIYISSCNNIYYELNKTIISPVKDINNIDEYFGNKYKIIPCYYYNNVINENYIYEYIIDAFSYFYANPSADKIDLVYEDYRITATKNNNIITFTNLIKGNNIELTNIIQLYNEFNECFYRIAFPKKYCKEYTIIGSGETDIIKSNYDFIFVNKL
ncbi:MAG: hypothetical protein IJ997_01645, partial [Mycoplasmataceae bacterium]|nr:hypothetical protein [Mycoplasmataceae bacterium]